MGRGAHTWAPGFCVTISSAGGAALRARLAERTLSPRALGVVLAPASGASCWISEAGSLLQRLVSEHFEQCVASGTSRRGAFWRGIVGARCCAGGLPLFEGPQECVQARAALLQRAARLQERLALARARRKTRECGLHSRHHVRTCNTWQRNGTPLVCYTCTPLRTAAQARSRTSHFSTVADTSCGSKWEHPRCRRPALA